MLQVAYSTKEVDLNLADQPMKFNGGGLAKLGLTSLVNE